MGDVFLDAFIDSLKVLAVLVVVNFLIALIEPKIAGKIKFKGKVATLVGVSVGLLPQCGFSVVATDLYKKRHITVGTLLGVYLATSDEALPIFLANPDKALHILPILACKFVLGLLVGYLADLIYTKSRKEVEHHHEECEHEPEIHIGCCHHEIEEENHDDGHDHSHCEEPCGDEIEHKIEKRKENLHKYLIHPLVHSLKIFAYVFVINIIFGIIIYYVGEDKLIAFLSQNKYIAPLLSVVIGAIPNCASSVVISNLYILGGLGFGATVGGLCMNAGLGFAILFKDVKHTKENFIIFLTMFLISVGVAYAISAICNFDILYI